MPDIEVSEASTEATSDDSTTVEVTVTPPETAEAEATPDVVVVESGGDASPEVQAVVVEATIEDARKLATLEAGLALAVQAIEAQDQRIAAVELEVQFARETAESAEAIAAEPVAVEPDVPQAPPAEDSEPNREHPFFRSIFGGKN